MDDVQSVTMGIQTRIGRHHTSVMKKSILRRKSVLKDLNKEILEWQVKDQGEGDEQGHNAGAISMNNPTVYRSHMHQFLSWVTNVSGYASMSIYVHAVTKVPLNVGA